MKGRKRVRIHQTKAIKRYYSTIYLRGYNAGRKIAQQAEENTIPVQYSNTAITLTGLSCAILGVVIGLLIR